ncbi:lycopene beta-cyclase CrtY [Novosphingobium sp. FSY-8]|uniref:Lycopene beta-cyclase CrtY n=1 Tax=Novosphingobium ovatum TaxID=1908523 RepID=A0ABW9XG56_9SPHN|nr:lycopene beta-cyclase CrtY [Novosphingobium ovatum]NBC37545.1 lycopene beta-cyclase CrtY [Novosphingobium ovatum]
MAQDDFDLAILGAGLAGGLLALALAQRRPELRVVLVESGAQPGGNHVWSFFSSDIADADRWLIDPLISVQWPAYTVRFDAYARQLDTPYASVTSEALADRLAQRLPAGGLMTGAQVVSAHPRGFTLADGRGFTAGAVIDARGCAAFPHLSGGWQKFVGLMLRTDAPHGQAMPTIMDAQVAQTDGYRFVYTLPFAADRLFVEDTYYADTPDVDVTGWRAAIMDYAGRQGLRVAAVEREEVGCLPVVGGGDFGAFWRATDQGLPRIGSAAALFHPLTGFSLPKAVETARVIAQMPDLSAGALARFADDWARAHWDQTGYYRLLANMAFAAALPEQRHRVFQHFYRLERGLVERFYAGRSRAYDRARILMGRPPVPVGRAVRALMGRGQALARLDILEHNGAHRASKGTAA